MLDITTPVLGSLTIPNKSSTFLYWASTITSNAVLWFDKDSCINLPVATLLSVIINWSTKSVIPDFAIVSAPASAFFNPPDPKIPDLTTFCIWSKNSVSVTNPE